MGYPQGMAPRAGEERIGARLAAGFALVIFVIGLAVMAPVFTAGSGLRDGDRAAQTYVAARNTQFESPVLTDRLRDDAAARVADAFFPPDPGIGQAQRERLVALLDGLREIRGRELSTVQRLAEAARLPGAERLSPVLGSIVDLDRAAFDDLDRRARGGLEEAMRGAITTETARGKVQTIVSRDPPAQGAAIAALTEILGVFVVPNVTVDAESTSRAREAARASITPAVVTYARGQVIVQGGSRLNAADIEALKRAGVLHSGFDWMRTIGVAVVAAGVAILLGGALAGARTVPSPARPRLALVAGAFAVTAVAARVGLAAALPDTGHSYVAYAIPVATASMVAAVLVGFSFAAIVAIGTGILVAIIAATVSDVAASRFVGSLEALQLAIVATAAGLAGAVPLSGRHGAVRYLAAAATAATAAAAASLAFWLIGETRANAELPRIAIASATHGVAAAALAGLALAAFSRRLGLGRTGDLTRLANPLHPLLVRLQEEAPGTYHHSMLVATLAEASARRIGADPLLARVGAAFHDIGKLAAPAYFIENNLDGTSRHDGRTPEESATIIRAHVRDGLALARDHGLPPVVQDFIPQHHGTRLVSYFFRRAEEAGRVADLTPFRYDGPRPRSREAAIVMLADSCEATVRSHLDRNSGRIDETVDAIFAERVAEGQLDESGLTVAEVRTVAAVMKESLRAVHHERIPYPQIGPDELARIASS